jgi:hypothetical protein
MPNELRQLRDFEGHWSLSRCILQDAGSEARFEGQAVWTPEADRLIYREVGTLTVADQPPMRAERCYHWHEGLRVHFEDGRFFHTVPPEGGEANHWCDPDSYHVRYDFTRWPAFDVTWHVIGPQKSYRMHSLYRPL